LRHGLRNDLHCAGDAILRPDLFSQFCRTPAHGLVGHRALDGGGQPFGGQLFLWNWRRTGPQIGDTPAPKGPSPEQASKILALEKEVSANPGNVDAWTELGHHFFDSHQHEKAIEAYRKALALRPDNANIWTDMGVMYRDIGKSSEALAAFDKAMQIDPRHEVSRFNKGIVLMMDMGDHKGAVETWEELLKINPSAKAPNGEPIKELLEKMRGTKQGE